MQGLKELYKIGHGPSSSHTLAPERACRLFLEHYSELMSYEVELFGSLALTGKGHSTDLICKKVFAPKMCKVFFNANRKESFPNGLIIRGFDEKNREKGKWTVFSVGGGSIEVEEIDLNLTDEIYPENTLDEIMAFCQKENLSLEQYAFIKEKDLYPYLSEILTQMLKTVRHGLDSEGMLPGSLKIEKVAKGLYLKALGETEDERLRLISYAYAASEENADMQVCVTAPTLGSSGVIAALMYFLYFDKQISRDRLIKALAIGGIFGNIIKTNATISGAVGGCQAEIGAACSMGSAMIAYLKGLNDKLIAYAAEIGMEHNLGLTCDPVGGYVMIPCIERNATTVLRCFDNASIAENVGGIKENKVSFDEVVRTMKYTGQMLAVELKETSLGGLAIEIQKNKTSKPKEPVVKTELEKKQEEIIQEVTEPILKSKEEEVLEPVLEEKEGIDASPEISYEPEDKEESISDVLTSYLMEENEDESNDIYVRDEDINAEDFLNDFDFSLLSNFNMNNFKRNKED